jgi:hypothetical protein
MQIAQTVVGAGIALLGVVLTQLWQDHRDKQRWVRETTQVAVSRNHDARRAALLGFLERVNEVWDRRNEEVVLNSVERPPPDTERVWLSVSAARVAVDVYGAAGTRSAAQRLEEAAVFLIDQPDADDGWGDLLKAREVYIEQVRDDLGIA